MNLDQYQAAREGAAYYPLREARYLQINGADRLNFLQRQTTNDLRLLKPGTAMLTVLTSSTARILDVFSTFYELPEEGEEDQGIVALTCPGNPTDSYQFLKSRIFFMDRIILADFSDRYAQLELLGGRAKDILKELGIERAPEQNQISTIKLNGGQHLVRVLNLTGLIDPGYRLVVPREGFDALVLEFKKLSVCPIDSIVYECIRIEAGLPAGGSEISQEYTPLEIGLRKAVSDTKGCYTGQEIIARQITYDKTTRSLCGVRLSKGFALGSRLFDQDNEIGRLTSLTYSPTFGFIALAVVKRPYNQPGTSVQVEKETGEVVSLPFMA